MKKSQGLPMEQANQHQGRPLGLLEYAFKVGHELTGAYNLISIVRIQKLLDAAKFAQTLETVSDTHPILRTVFKKIRHTECFQPGSDFRPSFMFYDYLDRKPDAVAHELIGQRIDDNRLWRVVLIRDEVAEESYLILAMHHALMDGRSRKHVVDAIIHTYFDEQRIMKPQTLQDPIEKQISGKASSAEFFIKRFLDDIRFPWDDTAYVPYAASAGPRSTQWHQWCLSAEQFNVIREQGRKHSLTINSLLAGHLMKAMALALASQSLSPEPKNYLVSTPRGLERQTIAWGNRFFQASFRTKIAPSLHWAQLGALYQKTLRDEITKPFPLPNDFTPNRFWQRLVRRSLAKERPYFKYLFQISNIGAVDKDASHPPDIVEYYGVSSRNFADVFMTLNVVGFHDSLFLTLSYCLPQVRQETANQVASLFIQSLLAG